MVILFVAPLYEAKGEKPKGGISMYLRRVTGALKELGHTPIILTVGKKDTRYIENGVEVLFVRCPYWRLKSESLHVACNILIKNLVINRKIKELLKERKIDLIQFASIWSFSFLYYGRTPAVMRMSIYSKVYRQYKENKADIDTQAFFERLAVRHCNAVFAPSKVIADAFAKDIHRKVSVIESPFWNDNTRYDDSLYQEKLGEKKYFLFFGRLVADKGILVIAECLQQFLREHIDYYFVCCGIEESGGGENPVRILKKAAGEYQERFLYMRALPHSTLYPIVQNADFVVFPSLIDNFPNACLEAMYFRRVVIGTDGTSFEQLIEDGKSGFLCAPNDADSLLEKMEEAACMDDQQRKIMGEYAKKRIDMLSPEFTVKKLVRYYQYVIEHSKR